MTSDKPTAAKGFDPAHGICPECEATGQVSRVTTGFGAVTLMGWTPYYDEQGVYHVHDPNRHTMPWRCSKGHSGTNVDTPKCPAPGCSFGRA